PWIALAVGISVSLPFVLLQTLGHMPVDSVAVVGLPGNVGLFYTSNVLAEVSTVAFSLMVVRGRYLLAALVLVCALLSGRWEVYLMLAAAGVAWPRTSKVTLIALWCLAVTFCTATLLGWEIPASIRASMGERFQVWTDTVHYMDWLGAGFGTYGTVFSFY